MKEVLENIGKLYTLIVEKDELLDQQLGKLKDRKAKAEEVDRIQAATASNLSARERLVGKAEDFQKDKEEVKATVRRVSVGKLDNAKVKGELEKRDVELVKKEKEVEEMRLLFKRKNANMDAMEIQLREEKKLMREKVLEEIKGKL